MTVVRIDQLQEIYLHLVLFQIQVIITIIGVLKVKKKKIMRKILMMMMLKMKNVNLQK